MSEVLLKTIYTYRAGWNAYLAASLDDDDAPQNFKPALGALEQWNAPAATREEAIEALRLAAEFYAAGSSDVIRSMLKASLAYFDTPSNRRAAP